MNLFSNLASRRLALAAAAVLGLGALWPAAARADAAQPDDSVAHSIVVAKDKSAAFRLDYPVGEIVVAQPDMLQLVVQLVSSSFALGLQLAAPFLVFGFAVYAALGVLSKLMPQLQVFFVAVPIGKMYANARMRK